MYFLVTLVFLLLLGFIVFLHFYSMWLFICVCCRAITTAKFNFKIYIVDMILSTLNINARDFTFTFT